MFSNLLFLILVLLIISLSPQGASLASAQWISSTNAFWLCLGIYLLLLVLIYLQNRCFPKFVRRHKAKMLLLVNMELVAFLIVDFFILGGMRIFSNMPETLPIVYGLGMYLFGLGLFHATSFDSHSAKFDPKMTPIQFSLHQLRMIAPFTLPFIGITLFFDLLSFIPNVDIFLNSMWGGIFLFIIGALVLLLLMIFLPYAIQKIWKCQPLDDGPFKERLENLCKAAHFKHAGLMTWTVLDHALTAAIIGLIPRFRYVIFTKRLLQEMPPEMVEAILAHEIGHSYRKHLWIYPFVIFGISVLAGLYSVHLEHYLIHYWGIASQQLSSPSWRILFPLILVIPYLLILVIYFRFVFGFFSRQFERQADLHVFNLNIHPNYLVEALNHIGIATGNSHKQPNWHHFSIQERIDFLNGASQNPKLIEKHHRFVKISLGLYALILIIGIYYWLAT